MDSPGTDTGETVEGIRAGVGRCGSEAQLTIQFDKHAERCGVWTVPPEQGLEGHVRRWQHMGRLDGFISEFGDSVEREKLVTTEITIKISSKKPTFTPASSGS